MSLIADALQKATTSPPASPPSRPPRSVWVYLIVGFCGLALIAATRSLIRASHPSAPTTQRLQVVRPPLAAASPPTSRPSTPASPPLGLNLLRAAESQWQLNGIVRGGEGRPLALINGDLVEEGSTVRGAKVIRVASDEVDLETDGKIRTLKLR